MANNVHIGNVIRNAIVFNFRKPEAEVMHAEALLEAVAQLFTLLHERQVAYLLVSSPYTFFLLNGDMELYRNR